MRKSNPHCKGERVMSNAPVKLDPGEELLIPEHWTLVSKDVNIAKVTDGQRQGVTPIKNHGIDFKCARCEYYGPWNGVVCLSCGNRYNE
jgi:hypothetical protein